MYRIGTRPQAYHTLRETLSDAGVAAWRRIRQAASRAFGPWRNGRRLCPGAADEAVAGSAEATHGNGDCADVSPRLEGDHFWALKDVSFEVQPGEVVGIIGRNGAGKSTLLKILSRITEPTAGRVELRGRVGSLLEVGTGFHPELTGRENIYLNGSILGMSRREIQRKFDEIVAFAEIEDFLDTPVKRYSSGMYVRLAFAVAAHLEPEILIVDEVLAVGDAAFQQKCLGKMQNVASHGRTVLLVSHNMSAINSLARTAILLKLGRIAAIGHPRDVTRQYFDSSLSHCNIGSRSLITAIRQISDHSIRFSRITLLNSVGQCTHLIRATEPFTVLLDIHSDRDMTGEAGWTLKTLDEYPLFTCSTNDNGALVHFKKGLTRLAFHVSPNYLCSGRYVLQVGITAITCRDLIPNAITLEITPPSRDGARAIYTLPGHLQFPYSWSVDYPPCHDISIT
jgi:lipopolysaccharide transport system ATP-binding protein